VLLAELPHQLRNAPQLASVLVLIERFAKAVGQVFGLYLHQHTI